MSRLFLVCALCSIAFSQAPAPPATEEQAQALRALVSATPGAKLRAAPLAIQPPDPDWTTDYVSSVAAARDGTIYVLHRNLKVDPVLAIDAGGRIVRSWGRGLYTNPHSIRVDPDGNLWLLQEVTTRFPGRVAGDTTYASVDDLAQALRRAEAAHGEHEKRTGQRDANWPAWYAEYMVAEQAGKELPL